MTLSQRLRSSFAMRMAALFLGLLALVQIASFTAISLGLGAHARSTLPDRLVAGERVLKSLLDQRAQTLTAAARLLAADFGFRDAVLSEDRETIGSVLENHGARIGATEVAWLGLDFSLRATAGAVNQGQIGPAAASLAATASNTGSASGLVLVAGKPHQLVLVPMKAPDLKGWVAIGFPLDDRLGAEMRALASLDLTLLARAGAGSPWQTTLSTLDAEAAQRIAAQPWNGLPVEMASLSVTGEELGLRPRWLPMLGADREAGPAALALLSLSIDEAARTPRELQALLLVVTLVGVAVFAFGSLYTARRVTTPLRALAGAAERLGAGDYDTPMRALDRSDEVGELAQSFERMRISVGEKQAQILRLAYWDTLTGLPNRAQFGDVVRQAVQAAEGAGTTVAVLMLDLDRFKNINAKLGYAVGDQLLRAAAERLSRQVMREGDLVARRSGDEFAVLLREATPELALSVAQRIARAFEQPIALDEHRLDLPVGVGVACWPQHAGDADTLINRAEMAMYAAKRRHGGPLVYESAMDDSSAQSLTLLSELREAVAREQLRLHLQPKMSLSTGAVVGAEALVRWEHPVRGMVSPGQFIPFAEQTGFIRTLTMWVFEACARVWRELHAEGASLVLSVNLSVRDLLDTDLPLKLEALLVKHRVPAEAFCLEITESAIMDDPQRAMATLNRLALMGFKLSIDDFGEGQTSIRYFKELPVDELKIDMFFIRELERSPEDVKIVRSLIDLAHNLGLQVVAEGVENARTWDILRELGCDEAQGFHLGKPMPAQEFLGWSVRWVENAHKARSAGSAGLLH